MALIKCKNCGKEISSSVNYCIHCGYPIESEIKQYCKECGKEISKNEKVCPNCGLILDEEPNNNKLAETISKNNKIKIPKAVLITVIVLILLTIIVVAFIIINQKNENSKAIKVDIKMNSYYGSIEDILDDFGIEFYAVTSGANCYSGVKTNQFETEKYGILYTEFTYCKLTSTQRFRIYNMSRDQELRDPKPGEINYYDAYGNRNYSSNYEV